MHAGGAGERLVQLQVAAVEHARAVDDRLPAVLAEVGQLPGQDLEDLRPVHGDVRGVLGPRNHRQQRLVDGDDAQFRGRDGPRTVLTVCPAGAWNVSPVATGGV